MEHLILLFNNIKAISDPLDSHLRQIVEKVEYKKGDVILHIGQVCRHICFIESGYIRVHFLQQDGKDVTTWFLLEGDFAIAVSSFFTETPSRVMITAEEDCVVWQITRQQLNETCEILPEFYYHRVIITERYHAQGEERDLDCKMLDTKQVCQNLFDKRPELFSRVKLMHLASYLNMSYKSVERFRDKNRN